MEEMDIGSHQPIVDYILVRLREIWLQFGFEIFDVGLAVVKFVELAFVPVVHLKLYSDTNKLRLTVTA